MLVCSFTTCLVSFIICLIVCTFLLTKQQKTLASFSIYVIVCSFLLTVFVYLMIASSAKPVSQVGGHA